MKITIVIFSLLAILTNDVLGYPKKKNPNSGYFNNGQSGGGGGVQYLYVSGGKNSKRDSTDQTAIDDKPGQQGQYLPNYYAQIANSQLKGGIEYARPSEYQTISYSTQYPGGNLINIQQPIGNVKQQQQLQQLLPIDNNQQQIQYYPTGLSQHHNSHLNHQQQQQFIYAITVPTAQQNQQFSFAPIQAIGYPTLTGNNYGQIPFNFGHNHLSNHHQQQQQQLIRGGGGGVIQYANGALPSAASNQQYAIFSTTPNNHQQKHAYIFTGGNLGNHLAGNYLQNFVHPGATAAYQQHYSPPKYAISIQQQQIPMPTINELTSTSSVAATPVPIIEQSEQYKNYLSPPGHQNNAGHSTFTPELPPPSINHNVGPNTLQEMKGLQNGGGSGGGSSLMNGGNNSLGRIYYSQPSNNNGPNSMNNFNGQQMYNPNGGKEIISFTPPPSKY